MGGQQTITLSVSTHESSRIRSLMELGDFEFGDAPHALWRARGTNCTVTFYTKGKVVLQGAGAQEWAEQIDAGQTLSIVLADPFEDAMDLHPDPKPARWIGIDETGKGDYFGPLVVTAAAVDRDQVPLLRELGIGDSKKIADSKIKKMAVDLKVCCSYEQVVIGLARYNDLYAKIGNLNRLLGWAHARVLENLLEKEPDCTFALSDQFARDERVVGRYLGERGRSIRYHQRTKGESDPAVAVASIIARAEFLWQMKRLDSKAGFTVPRGAGAGVITAGRRIVEEHGQAALKDFVKLHFSTTDKLGVTD